MADTKYTPGAMDTPHRLKAMNEALLAITAERDRLREATRICLSWVKTVAGQAPNRMTREIIKTAEAALANAEPESGDKDK